MKQYWTKRIKAFGYAFRGLADLLRTQAHAQIHLLAIVCVGAAGWYFKLSKTEWLAVVLAMALVLALEAVNTAIEYLTDLVSPDYHPLAGKAKDVAAAAVLIAAIGAVIVGGMVFLPRVLG